MVDGHCQQRRLRRVAVEIGFEEKKQRGGITATGYGDKGAIGKIDMGKQAFREAGHGVAASVRPERRQHEACARSCLTRALSALEALG